MKIILILKDNLNHRPPILNVAQCLRDLHCDLTLIVTGIEKNTKEAFEAAGCRVHIIDCDSFLARQPKIGKAFRWLSFRRQVFNILKKEQFDFLWLASADATLALGKKLLQYRYILQIQELYDTEPRYHKNLKIFMRNAKKVFVPEEVRAHIFRAWYQLKETPVVLPNKPYGHPRTRNLPITDPAAAKAFARIPKDATILFYQGGVNKSRNIRPFLEAVISLGHPWCLAIQCPRCDYDYVRENYHCNNVYYIPYIPAPRHLEITSHVHVGLVTYEHLHMNNEFCAPNKIWEYVGFGLPIIGNDVYGLSFPIQKYNFGVTVNPDVASCSEIKQKLLCITNNEEQYSMNAKKFFDSFNLEENIKRVLDTLCIEGKNR